MTLKCNGYSSDKTLSFMNELPAVADEVVEVDGIIYNKKTLTRFRYGNIEILTSTQRLENNIRELIRLLYGDRKRRTYKI